MSVLQLLVDYTMGGSVVKRGDTRVFDQELRNENLKLSSSFKSIFNSLFSILAAWSFTVENLSPIRFGFLQGRA